MKSFSPALEGPIHVTDQGAWSIKGRRKTQEDAFLLHELHDTKDRSILLAGVLDGHLGSAASDFVRDELPVSLSTALNVNDGANVENLVEDSWNDCCDNYRAACLSEDVCVALYDVREGILMANTGSKNAVAGTTATVFALDKKKGYIAALNCGDSRGVVFDVNGIVRFSTKDHKPETEIDRLSAGRKLGFDYSMPKCLVARWSLEVGEYDYAVGRSLEGTFATSRGIVSKADVSLVQAKCGMSAIVATDGLWDVVDIEEASRIASSMRVQGKSASDVAKRLASLAYTKGSADNISVVVLYID
jgi:serine/threonine protein phosphatase PrpC